MGCGGSAGAKYEGSPGAGEDSGSGRKSPSKSHSTSVAISKALCNSAITGAKTHAAAHKQLVETFQKWDVDGNGSLSPQEVLDVCKSLNMKVELSDIADLFAEVDTNGDGDLQYSELADALMETPQLPRYFKLLAAISAEFDAKSKQLAFGDESIKQEEALQKWLEKQYTHRLHPLIKQIFAHHDKDDSGALSRDESVVLFSSYISKLQNFAEVVVQVSLDHQVAAKGDGKASTKVTDKMNAFVKEQLASFESEKDKNSCYKQAFQLLDSSGDGEIQVQELLEALTPGRYRYREFHKAMKLVTPEVLEAKVKEFTFVAKKSDKKKKRDS